MIVEFNNKNKLVVQHNGLINGIYNFDSINELRIFVYMLLNIQKGDKEFREIEIPCKVLIPKGKYIHYNEIRKASKTLSKKVISVETRVKGKRRYMDVPLMSLSMYTEGDGYLIAKFNQEAAPFLLNLTENFTSSHYRDWANISSVYSYRIYWMLKQYQDYGQVPMDVSDIREKLELKEKYSRYSDMRKRILDPVQKDLRNTDMAFEYEEIKQGRNIAKIKFNLINYPNGQLNGQYKQTLPTAANSQHKEPAQSQLDFGQQADGMDKQTQQLLKMGMVPKDIEVFRQKIPDKRLKRILYGIDAKWSGSAISKEELLRITRECLCEEAGLDMVDITISSDNED